MKMLAMCNVPYAEAISCQLAFWDCFVIAVFQIIQNIFLIKFYSFSMTSKKKVDLILIYKSLLKYLIYQEKYILFD